MEGSLPSIFASANIQMPARCDSQVNYDRLRRKIVTASDLVR